MVCSVVKLPDGASAIVCGSRPRAKKCNCGSGLKASLLCDFPMIGEGHRLSKTCDAPCCQNCAAHIGPDRDYCRAHAPRAA